MIKEYIYNNIKLDIILDPTQESFYNNYFLLTNDLSDLLPLILKNSKMVYMHKLFLDYITTDWYSEMYVPKDKNIVIDDALTDRAQAREKYIGIFVRNINI